MKNSPRLKTEHIENAVMKLYEIINSKKIKRKSWFNHSEKELWLELISCILGSQVHYETAKSCIIHLQRKGLLDIQKTIEMPEKTERELITELNKPIYSTLNGKKCKYRFYRSKSRLIVKTGIEIYVNSNSTIKDILKKSRNGFEARKILIKKCFGIGPKQASLFLRNISYCDNLAILDSHVARYIKLLKLNDFIQGFKLPRNLYLKNEKILTIYASLKGKNLGILDVAIWTVMRIAQREFGL